MTDYSQGKIYMIKSKNTEDVYIGSTKESLEERFHFHMMHYHKWLRTKKNYYTSFEIIKHGEPYIELLEDYPCESRKQLDKREGEYQRMMDCVNKNIAGRTRKEYYQDNKEYRKEYYQDNKDHIKEYTKEYQEEHREYYNEKSKERYQNNKKKILLINKIKIKCVCGSEHRKADTRRHQRSQKHIKYIQEMKEKADATNLNEFFEQFKFKLEIK